MHLYHNYTDTLHYYFMYLLSPLYGYSVTLATVLISLLHRFNDIHALIVSVFLLHESLLLSHGLLLHEYSFIPITWLFSVIEIDIIILLLGYTDNWSKMYGSRCHTEQSATSYTWWGPPLGPVRATFRIPRLIDLMLPVILYMSCYLVTCYMPIHVMLSRYLLYALLLLPIHCIFYLW